MKTTRFDKNSDSVTTLFVVIGIQSMNISGEESTNESSKVTSPNLIHSTRHTHNSYIATYKMPQCHKRWASQ